MLDAVSWREEACCSVRDDRSTLPDAIWLEPVAMLSAAWRTLPIRMNEARLASRPSMRARCPPAHCWRQAPRADRLPRRAA